MKYYPISIKLADIVLSCIFEYEENQKACIEFQTSETGTRIQVSDYEKQVYLQAYPENPWDAQAESKTLLGIASDALLEYNRLLMHAVAIRIENQVILISAPSGTGKSTQYRNLKQLYGESIEILNGDNVALHFQENQIVVHSTPWKGKEGYGKVGQGKLAGIIFLKQSKKDKIQKMELSKAVYPIFHEIHTYAKTEESVHQLFKLEKQLLTTIPIYQFENTGTLESSKVLNQTIRKEILHDL